MNRTVIRAAAPAALALLLLTACGGQNEADAQNPDGQGSTTDAGSGDEGLSGEVLADGSSTVDPLTSAACSLAEVRAMFDEMVAAERDYLPEFLLN